MSAQKVHIDVHRCVQTLLGAIVVHVELDIDWQMMVRGAMVRKHFFFFFFCFLMPSKCHNVYEIQILMNVKKILMAAITSAPTPLDLIPVAVVQALDLHLMDSLAMVLI